MARDKTGWVVGEVLARQSALRGDRPFLQFQDEKPVTYGEVDTMANRVAQGLARLGVGHGHRVGVMLGNRLEYCLAWFGISRLGAVHVAINTAYRGFFLEHVLTNSAPEILIIDRSYLNRLEEIEERVPSIKTVLVPELSGSEERLPSFRRIEVLPFESLLEAPAQPPEVAVSYRDIGSIMYTSGTTGPSKGVLMPHAHLYLFGLGTVEIFRMSEDDVYYICMPLFHSNALLMQLYGTLISGSRAVIVPGFSASNWISDIRRHGVTLTNTLGVMNAFILAQPERPEDRDSRLRAVLGIPCPPEFLETFRRRFDVPMMEGYGMTEVNITMYNDLENLRPGSCGKAYEEFFEVKLVNPDTDEEVEPGAMGEIVVRNREPFCFMQGYNGMEAKTVAAWRNFWFHTGDAATQDGEGFFYYVDRIRDCIRVRGENISSYEIEQVVGEHPDVAEVAAIALKSAIRGGEDEVKVCIVLREGARSTPEQVLDFCQPRMPYFAVPRYVEFIAELPKTPTQKVQKAKLREAGLTPATWDREAAGYKVRR